MKSRDHFDWESEDDDVQRDVYDCKLEVKLLCIDALGLHRTVPESIDRYTVPYRADRLCKVPGDAHPKKKSCDQPESRGSENSLIHQESRDLDRRAGSNVCEVCTEERLLKTP